jgi:hypothetical protein
MARYCSNYFEHPSLDNIARMREMLLIKEQQTNIKSFIYAELISSLGKKPAESLDERDMEDLLKGLAHLQRYPPSSNHIDFFIQNDIQKAILKHTGQISKFLFLENQPNSSLINKILKEVFPEEAELSWQVSIEDGTQPVFYASDIKYHPLSGRFVFPG